MITLLTGENSFEIARALKKIVDDFEGNAEKIDGSELELSDLPNLFMGTTLFAESRLVIIKALSENKPLWDALPDLLQNVNSEIHIVMIEPKPDKRTRTFKELKSAAELIDFAPYTERDTGKVALWAMDEAKKQGIELDNKSAQLLVDRVGTDQWQLSNALEKLSVLDVVTPEIIEEAVDQSSTENVFNLFEAALGGDSKRVVRMIDTLEMTEEPHMVFGLLSGQVFQLVALATSNLSSAQVAGDIGAHPYALSKLSQPAKRLGVKGAEAILKIFASADRDMKSGGDPWLVVERALIKVAVLE